MIKEYFMNRETGELLTYKEMIVEGEELYDLNEDTNVLEYLEYYKRIISEEE